MQGVEQYYGDDNVQTVTKCFAVYLSKSVKRPVEQLLGLHIAK